MKVLKSKFRVSTSFMIAALLLVGCSKEDLTLESIGNTILSGVGLGALTSSYSASQNLGQSLEDMNREEEYYLGRAVAASILTTYPALLNDPLNIYVNKVGLAVAAASDLPETFGGYHFIVLDSNDINAMSAPGGFIFITRGMLEIMPDEDALAAVLAHEIVHVTKKHGLEAISQSHMTSALLEMGKVASSLNCTEILQQATTIFGGAVQDITETLIEKGYSREQEYEADSGAVLVLYRAGYNPHSVYDMVAQVEKAFAENKSGWFNTHPESSERMLRIAKQLEKENIPELSAGKVLRALRFENQVRIVLSS